VNGGKGQVWPADKNDEGIAVSGETRTKSDVANEAVGAEAEAGSKTLEALVSDLGRLGRSPGAAVADSQPAEEAPDVNGPAVVTTGDAERIDRELNTAGIDALFAALARDRQLPEIPRPAAANRGRMQQPPPTPEASASTAAARTEHSEFEPTPVRTLLGSFTVALSMLVMGPLALLGLHQARRGRRFRRERS
jgi:hypothetical protein